MKESFWGVFLVTLGIIGISVLNVLQSVTTTNENNYYLLREVTESAMFDAVDLGHYRRTGELKIIEQKFVENFTRRFSMAYGRTNTYNVGIYDIIEVPPKVSLIVEVNQNLRVYNYSAVDFDIGNRIDAILENKFPATANVSSAPAIPGVFVYPTSTTTFKNNTTLNVAWVETTSWGKPNTNSQYRLEVKCGDGSWTFIGNPTSEVVPHTVSCVAKTLQYRVRAESDGGYSNWRYSEEAKVFDPSVVPPASFAYTGGAQSYSAPESGYYKLEVWGAQGGYGYASWPESNQQNGTGGAYGAYATGAIWLDAGQILYIYVGGSPGKNYVGGYNGGGSATYSSYSSFSTFGGAGGGATDFRLVGGAWDNAASLDSRVIVAGGGGGTPNVPDYYYSYGNTNSTSNPGTPTYPDGYYGVQASYDNAGRPSNYGDTSHNLLGTAGQPGTFGKGGAGGTNSYVVYSKTIYGVNGNGGGGGYYGGGGGAGGAINTSARSYYYGGTGGGGSSYTKNLQSPGSIRGGSNMPKPSGGSAIGNAGHGAAKITYLGP